MASSLQCYDRNAVLQSASILKLRMLMSISASVPRCERASALRFVRLNVHLKGRCDMIESWCGEDVVEGLTLMQQ